MSSLTYNYLTVIYHSRDMDGWTSAAIISKKYPGCNLIGYDYGEPIPTLPATTTWIVMVDVSVEPAQMRKLASLCKFGITYIDHHASSIKKIEDDITPKTAYNIGRRYNKEGEKLAACELTWQWCYPHISIPLYVELIGSADAARDTTRYPENKSRNAYLKTLSNTFISPQTCPPWVLEKQGDMTSSGYDENTAEFKARYEYCIKHAFEDTVLGLSALCLEVKKLGHENFDGIDIDAYAMRIAFLYNAEHNHWKCSIYTNEMKNDASLLAMQLDKKGGGGHKNAAGFQVADITTVLKNYK